MIRAVASSGRKYQDDATVVLRRFFEVGYVDVLVRLVAGGGITWNEHTLYTSWLYGLESSRA